MIGNTLFLTWGMRNAATIAIATTNVVEQRNSTIRPDCIMEWPRVVLILKRKTLNYWSFHRECIQSRAGRWNRTHVHTIDASRNLFYWYVWFWCNQDAVLQTARWFNQMYSRSSLQNSEIATPEWISVGTYIFFLMTFTIIQRFRHVYIYII